MPRRYGPDGTALWNGKAPEEFTEADVYCFMAETEDARENAARPTPAKGKEARDDR